MIPWKNFFPFDNISYLYSSFREQAISIFSIQKYLVILHLFSHVRILKIWLYPYYWLKNITGKTPNPKCNFTTFVFLFKKENNCIHLQLYSIINISCIWNANHSFKIFLFDKVLRSNEKRFMYPLIRIQNIPFHKHANIAIILPIMQSMTNV